MSGVQTPDGFPISYREGRIYGLPGTGLTVSYRSQWISGIYEDRAATELAIDLCAVGRDQQIKDLWVSRPTKTPLTTADLDHLRQTEGEK